jgi:hypothetical protein
LSAYENRLSNILTSGIVHVILNSRPLTSLVFQ